jgi:small subunit ribosomal protein S6
MANPQTAKPAGYETTFITRSDLSDDGLKALHERINGIIASYQGEVILTEDWGKRKLAYPISKETRAHYSYIVYTGRNDIVHEIERNLRIHDHILRFLSVNLKDEFDAEDFRKERAAIQAAAKRREEEREARREERMAERRGHDHHDRDRHSHHDHHAAADVGGAEGAGEEE